MIEFVSAILLVTRNMPLMVTFYRDLLRLPLVEETHGASSTHYGCELGDIHFAIHPIENFDGPSGVEGRPNVRLAFTVFDLENVVKTAHAAGVVFNYSPTDVGFALITETTDPDGNVIELTQLADPWFKHIERRRLLGNDVLTRWREQSPADKGKDDVETP